MAALEQQHRQWWKDFWTKSLIEIGDPALEKDYYLYNYQVGSSVRDKVFPPGLFGLWTTNDDPNWCGDYHLNFDWQSQYYAMYKCNLIEQADCFNQPCLDFMERGKWLAKNCQNCRGVYYPVGIWAKGMESSRQPGRRHPRRRTWRGVHGPEDRRGLLPGSDGHAMVSHLRPGLRQAGLPVRG